MFPSLKFVTPDKYLKISKKIVHLTSLPNPTASNICAP